MPDLLEANLLKLLRGSHLDGPEAEICDFSLEDQIQAMESRSKQPNVDPSFRPRVGETVIYIVACVIVDDSNRVLMMQEAKQSCAGKWYLPAGRMEKGETIVTACKREVLEETGLEIECTTLLMVEGARGSWMRFVLTGRVTGGKLKTPAEADAESLQAKWVDDLDELELRANDILDLIERGRAYKAARDSKDTSWFQDRLPDLRPYSKLLLRLVILSKKKQTNRVHLLLSEKTSLHIPACEVHPSKSLHSTLKLFMEELFGAEVPLHRPHGILSVEHDPSSGKDGVCLTLLVVFKAPLEEVPIISKCVWHETSKELEEVLLRRVANKNSTFPLHVI